MKKSPSRQQTVQEDLEEIVRDLIPWNKFSGKTVLITGATGFIASYLVETLLYLNEHKLTKPVKVICLSRSRKKTIERFPFYKNRKDIEFLIQDVCREIKYKYKVDYIIHAASHATPSKYGIDPVGTLLPNIIGTYNLLEFAKKQKLQVFLFVSSGEVYGESQITLKNIKENDFGSLNPIFLRSCYAESKRMGENMCISWLSQYNIPTKIVRLFHTYGPGMKLNDGRVHSDFVGDIVHNRNIVMKSEGRSTRPFCYISDVIKGIYTVLLKGVNGEAYNIGGEGPISIMELAELLISLCPEKNIKIIKEVKKRGNAYLASSLYNQYPINVDKIKALGWNQIYSNKQGFMRTINSFI